jgi:adenylate cyclase
MASTRRLTAILAADVAGYSRLIGTDEEGTLNRLKALRAELIDPKTTEHHGRIVKTTGDGLLVEFASVVDAVRCAVEVQAAMGEREADISPASRIEFRIGIHQGDIVVEDGDIFGDGVNVAARLEGIAEPGGICVSARVQEDAAGRLDVAFEDIGEPALKNIARAVRVYRIGPRAPRPHATGTAAAQPALALPDKPSVAVLPFANMSSDPEQEFLADGIAEDVITALSRYPSLFVTARNSTFTYKGRPVEIRQIGRDLGVRYVLEGSLRKAGNRIRVTAQLVEAETGNHVWAERYDRDLADIFAVQDEISLAAVIAIAPAIAEAERQRAMRKPPDSLDAWAAYQRGLWHVSKGNVDDNATAQELFARAIDLDPAFAGGYKGLAMATLNAAADFQVADLGEASNETERLIREAITRDGTDSEARALLSNVLRIRGQLALALAEAESALAVNPNLAAAHRARAAALIFSGSREDGIAAAQTSLRLEPRAQSTAATMNWIVCALYFCGEYAACAEAARRALQSYPGYILPYRWLVAALGQLGLVDEAGAALGKAIAVAPASFDMYVRNRVPWMQPEDYAHMLDGLRKAGWEG